MAGGRSAGHFRFTDPRAMLHRGKPMESGDSRR